MRQQITIVTGLSAKILYVPKDNSAVIFECTVPLTAEAYKL